MVARLHFFCYTQIYTLSVMSVICDGGRALLQILLSELVIGANGAWLSLARAQRSGR
jgi:hypothetical protein